MKALVTGATGFIGSHVAEKLIANGFEVRCLTRKSSNNKWLDSKSVEFVVADFQDKPGLMNAVEGMDYIFHIAGLNFANKRGDFNNVNTLGTKNLIDAVHEVGYPIKRFVYLSSQTATGPSESLEKPINEDTPRNPITAYGLSKKLAEDEVLAYAGKLPFTILKPPAVIGPRDTAIYGFFKMMHLGFAGLIGLNKKYISLIHSEDLSNGIVAAALSDKAIDQTYFLANDNFYHWDYIADVFKNQMDKSFYLKVKIPDTIVLALGAITGFSYELFGKQAKFNYDKAIDFTRKYWTCSSEKAKRDFDFKQTVSFENGIKQTFQWYKQHKWL